MYNNVSREWKEEKEFPDFHGGQGEGI